MSTPVGTIGEARLAALAGRLGVSARQLLIAAARIADAEPACANDPAFVRRVLEDARNDSTAAEAAARLLLTPVADYSINELDRLFAGLWPDAVAGQDE
jgi:hypothetical protein